MTLFCASLSPARQQTTDSDMPLTCQWVEPAQRYGAEEQRGDKSGVETSE